MSFLNFCTPTLRSMCHGGIWRVVDAALDRPRPRPRLLVGDERHRRDRVRLMARLALRLKNRRDVLRERDRGSRTRVSRQNTRRCDEHCAKRNQTGESRHGSLLHDSGRHNIKDWASTPGTCLSHALHYDHRKPRGLLPISIALVPGSKDQEPALLETIDLAGVTGPSHENTLRPAAARSLLEHHRELRLAVRERALKCLSVLRCLHSVRGHVPVVRSRSPTRLPPERNWRSSKLKRPSADPRAC